MRLALLAALALATAAGLPAQQQRASTAPCVSERPQRPGGETRRFEKLLREKGPDALVEEIIRTQREFFLKLKTPLLQPDGLTYFSHGLQGALLPEMSGALIYQTGSELVLGVSDPALQEISLRLDAPLRETLQPGTRVLFAGIVRDFAPQPFLLVFDVKRGELGFLPPKAGPDPR